MNALRIAIIIRTTTVLSGIQFAHAKDLEPISPNLAPSTGSFYRIQRDTAPLPYNRFPELPLYVIDWNKSMFLIDDRSVDYETLDAQMKAQAAESSPEDGGQVPFVPANYGCNLWLEISATDEIAMLTLHNTRPGTGYQILTNADLATTNWSLFLTNVADGSGFQAWTNIAIDLHTNLFFRASEGQNYVTNFYVTNLVFHGLNFTNTQTTPPDSMGAVGPNHFVELLNNGIAVYNKSGGLITQTNSANFFAVREQGGTNRLTGDSMVDPRILYDPQSDRWVASALDINGSNDVILAISASGDPTDLVAGWHRHLISVHREGFQSDFPTLGLDANGIYLRVLFYNKNSTPTTNAGHTIVAIKKREIYQPSPVLITNYFVINDDVPIWTIQPAVNFDDVPANGYAWFLGKGPPDLGASYQSGELYYRRLHWSGTSASLDTNWFVVPNPGSTYRDYYDLDGTNATIHASSGVVAEALGGSVPLFAVGSRLATVTIRNGFLWTCQTVGLKGTNGIYDGNKFWTNVDRSAIQWFRIQISSNATSLLLYEHGRTFDSVHETDSWWYYFGSLAVNCSGDTVAGFSGSSASNYISAFYTWRLANGARFESPQLIQPGTVGYNPTDFGDYSATTLDPADGWSFWTVQEVATPTQFVRPPWATFIAKIRLSH